MRRVFGIIIPVFLLLFIVGFGALLYWLGGDDQSALEILRDIVIVFIGVLWIIVVLLLAILVGAVIWLVVTIKEKVIPLLETLTDTANRVKGTAEFMSEEIASPVISFYGKVAEVRAMTRTVTGRDRKRGGFSRLLKR